ncbi:MAG: hypothetical protein ACRC7G_02345 [Beijerinckiaceae bacterium]
MRSALRRLTATFLVMMPISDAQAGAWLQPPGRLQVIFASTVSLATRGFGRDAPSPGTERFLKAESGQRIEFGVSENFTLLAGGEFSTTLKESGDGTDLRRIAKAGLGGRFPVFRWNGGLVSAEIEGWTAGEWRLTMRGRRHSAPTEARFSLLAGQGFPLAGRHAFADLRLGYHRRSGIAADSLELDATFGIDLFSRAQLMFQSFNAMSLNREGPGGRHWRRHKGQISLVARLTDSWSMQFGAFATLAGKNTLAERGVLVASWRRF